MKITNQSMMTGKMHTYDLDVTCEQLDKWNAGMLIQDAMPHLSADEREFLMTGTTPKEFKDAFGSDD